MEVFPAFVLLGRDGHAADYLHDGEWDDDTPEDIAPVLKSFVEGTYSRRRSPWHGGYTKTKHRSDRETRGQERH